MTIMVILIFFKIIQILKVGYALKTIFHAESNGASSSSRALKLLNMQISLKLIQLINHAKSTNCKKFQLLLTFSSLFTGSSSLSVFPRGVL